jgi:hypothetical protein
VEDVIEFTILSRKAHKAKKEHICHACKQPIMPGEKYLKEVAIIDGDFKEIKSHRSEPYFE